MMFDKASKHHETVFFISSLFASRVVMNTADGAASLYHLLIARRPEAVQFNADFSIWSTEFCEAWTSSIRAFSIWSPELLPCISFQNNAPQLHSLTIEHTSKNDKKAWWPDHKQPDFVKGTQKAGGWESGKHYSAYKHDQICWIFVFPHVCYNKEH